MGPVADSSVAITAGSGTPIRVLTGLGTGSADQQVVTLADSAGNLLGTTAAPIPVTGSGTAGTAATGVQTVQGIAGAVAVPVSGTFWQATQPVSLATNTPVIAAGAASIGTVGLNAGTNVVGTFNQQSSTLIISTTAAISTAVTATLPAAGAGLFHYITSIEVQRYAGAALTGAAAPTVVTTTNLPGSLAWSFDTAGAIGTSQIQLLSFAANPLKCSVANTATTIVAPLTTSVIWRINVSYYTA